MRILPFALLLMACAHSPRVPVPVPHAEVPDSLVKDYRQVREVPPAFSLDTMPLVVITGSDSVRFSRTTVAHRLGSGFITAEGSNRATGRPGSGYDIHFFDDHGVQTRHLFDPGAGGVALPILQLSVAADSSATIGIFGGHWTTIESSRMMPLHHSFVDDGVVGEWIGQLADGSIIGRTRENPDMSTVTGGVAEVGSAFVRHPLHGRAAYLPIVTSQVLTFFTMPSEMARAVTNAGAGTRTVTLGMGLPATAAWPVQPSSTALAAGESIWDFDVLRWQVISYDKAGAMKAAVRLPVPAANVGASASAPVSIRDAWKLLTMLDDDGQLWMERSDTPRAAAMIRPPLGDPEPQNTPAQLWGFATNGALIGSIDIPGGVRVLEIGPNFILGLQRRPSGDFNVVLYRLRPRAP
jgi:hypothetical protein